MKKYMWLIVVGVLIVAFALWGFIKTHWVKATVNEFCSEVVIGASIEGLEEKAKDMGLQVRHRMKLGDENAAIIAWEGWIFARWFCDVQHQDNKVVSKDCFFLD
jgi:hypothetical protein